MISVKLTTTKGELQAMALAAVKDMRNRAISVLQRAGEEAVNEARSVIKENDWMDRTGNLRSSIGYVICENGQPISVSKFEQVDGPDRGEATEDGSQTGRSYAMSLVRETQGLALVVVAGMKYAVYVADKGYNVLSSSQIVAQQAVKRLFEGWARYDKENG